jgi:PAS domain S-box-containing protein
LKPESDNVPNGASHDTDEQPTYAKGSPEEDYGWLRSVVENSSEIVTIVDVDGTLRYASPAFGRVLGHDPEEAIGTMNVLDLVHPDDLPHVLEETDEALSKGGVVTNKAEYRFRHRDGSWRWMESVGTYLLDDPHVGGVAVTSRDVTERKEAEEALRRSEAEIFGILESITDAFFSLDREWRFAYVNHQAEVLLNRSREDLVGERIWEDSTFYPQYRWAVAEGRTARFEAYYPPLEKWFSVRAYPSESGLSVYFQDVTERKKAEEKLRFQATLLDAVGDVVIALDMEGRVLYWNRVAEEMYGWSSEAAMGYRLMEMVVPESLWERAEDIAALVREGRDWTGEFMVRHRDGTTFPVEGTATPVFSEEGDCVGVIGVLRDISDRKEAEEALRESEQRFGNAFRDAAIGMALVGTDGRFLQVNRSLRKILGYSEGELLEKTFQEITHPDDVERDVVHLHQLRTGELETYQKEKRYFHKEGHVVQVLLSVSLVHDEKGKLLYFVSQIQDVTERKLAETELIRRTEELAHTNAELEQFTYSVSHDLRAPLRSVDGFSQVLLEDYAPGLDEEGQDYLRRVRAASQRMGELIDDLLELSRLNHSSVREETVDLGVLAKAFAEDLRQSQPDRQVEFVIEEGLVVQGDRRLLRVALNHLLDNAWKFTQNHPRAKIELGVRQGDGEPTYFVSDDGAGFDMAYAGKLFGPFQRLHSSTEFEGRGIGLAAVQRIIHRHGGRVWAEGVVGEGATFYFTLPHTRSDEQEQESVVR